ncbi:hypothetical protein O181_002695 [Austropuccinia psidii MF-1]|uniref:Uncharacterized protein n=1 Tax=Austropuccinia psidii MF-1 TaxID=1389203 RepID=A0A9Q3BCY7_9BASI|nr:hypothetical protein [Austropuccinia psidii MF-1]
MCCTALVPHSFNSAQDVQDLPMPHTRFLFPMLVSPASPARSIPSLLIPEATLFRFVSYSFLLIFFPRLIEPRSSRLTSLTNHDYRCTSPTLAEIAPR